MGSGRLWRAAVVGWLAACSVDPGEGAGDGSPEGDAPAQLPECPAFADGARAGAVASAEAVELSGLVASRAHPGVWWAHNDSGDAARLLAIGDAGEDLGVFPLEGASAADWEDLAIGPDGDGWTLWVGDIGDNFHLRAELWIWRVGEPDPGVPRAVPAERLRLRYADGPHDAETLLHDPRTGDLYVVTKEREGSRVWRAAAPVVDGAVLEAVASVDVGDPADPLITGGDVAPDGSAVLLRTYGGARLWRRGEGATVADAFATEPCAVTMADEPAGEAIAWEADGEAYRSVSEGPGATIWRYARR